MNKRDIWLIVTLKRNDDDQEERQRREGHSRHSPEYRDSTIYVAWEHGIIVQLATVMLTRFGSDAKIPAWPNSDYETVFVFTINWNEPVSLDFRVESQGLGPISEACIQAPGDVTASGSE